MVSKHHARLLEAILFIAERPVSIHEIKQKLNIKEDKELEDLLHYLRENLKKRKSFIQIVEMDQGRSIQMRLDPEKKKELDIFRTKKKLDKELMGTLAYIALKQPIKYGDLRQVRGKKTKEQIEILEKEGLIKIEPSRRSKVITTTLYFASVFNLDPNNIKETFKEELKKRMIGIIE